MSAAPLAITVDAAAAWARAGGVLVYPTETFYGLGADPSSDAAVRALFDLKGRDARVAIPLVASSVARVEEWCGAIDPQTAALAAAFWPGPLTLIFNAPARLSAGVRGGRDTVAIRVPSHPIARDLAERCGGLLTATSANLSGAPPATSVDAVGALVFDPRVRVVDGGRTAGGAPSTIVDARGAAPILIRDGAIAWNRVLESIKR